MEVWAKVTVSNGDKVHAADLVDEDLLDRWDATFVQVIKFCIIQVKSPGLILLQYSMLVDKMRHKPRVTPQFEATECFGQLRLILRFDLPAGIAPLITEATTLVLAIIRNADVSYETSLAIPYYKELGRLEAVDMSTVMCVVGRIKDHHGRWAVVDRSGKSARADFTE